ncbi:MAG TPA: universal stress protein [Bryobacteraceae bacterium]|nr:universal stress protein [Bryobacteraceae bacterium]
MKILVASNGSHDELVDPVASAASFPWPQSSEIHILHVAEVLQPVMVGLSSEAINVAGIERTSKAEAKKTVATAAAELRKLGFCAEGVSLEGAPETEIIDYAKRWGADLIVVGSHDRSLLERLLLGSISDGVVKHAPCSVLVVKHSVA